MSTRSLVYKHQNFAKTESFIRYTIAVHSWQRHLWTYFLR